MKILMATSECDPYYKVGGLGDVVPGLAIALKKIGHDVRIVLPKYDVKTHTAVWKAVNGPMIVNMGYGVEFARLLQAKYKTVPVYFIEFDKYFCRPGIYGDGGGSYWDNWERFAFFCRAVIDMCPFLNWAPDVIHANDWPTGIIPVLLKMHTRHGILGDTKSVFTIHNMAHHGYAPRELLKFAGLYDHYWHPFAMEACGSINVMKGALQFADKITTVSETYAEEIKTSAYGYGLDDVLRYRANDLIGICNGVDTGIWNPETDKFLPKNFSSKSMGGKSVCKQKLQADMKLVVESGVPIFSVISRFFEQKGLDVLCDILPDAVATMAIQFIALGSGDGNLERRFVELANRFPERIAVKIGFDAALAHLIEGGSDFFLMPSRYEPCGMNQMYSAIYGTLPIVRATGGLRDTVRNYDEVSGRGTGFVFDDLTPLALYNAIKRACATYYNCGKHFEKMQRLAMKNDFSWKKSAKKYEKIYSSLRAHRQYPTHCS
ncbi:MAG: glycogen synthase GlgA [Puniceicoccales bacterium]|jgi:starch synthase|nr:glycogen synthase GlgA [Puniceicoccales bacterium]